MDGIFELLQPLGYHTNLYEFFSTNNISGYEDGKYYTHLREPPESPQSLEDKFKRFQKFPKKQYLMKIFPAQVNEEILSYLKAGYYFLCLGRRNKLDQLWSFGWAMTTDKWENYDPEKTAGSIEYELRWYDHLMGQIKAYQETLSVLSDHSLYYYEDLDFKEVKSFHKKLQYPMEKSLLFHNREEIIERYENEI
ncbi:MAG: hypothetical protein IH795_11575 [Bacteroidetes bacterium]|nr:hypothetical protein [Bacteroidota bacterium]